MKMYELNGFFEKLYKSRPHHSVTMENIRGVLCLDAFKQMQSVPHITHICTETPLCEGVSVEKYEMEFLPSLNVPVWVLSPEKANGEAVLYCHGHDRHGAQGSFRRFENGAYYHKYLAPELARSGYTVVVPEFAGFGEVKYRYEKEPERDGGCYAPSAVLMMYGLNIAGLRVFEAISAVTFIVNTLGMEKITAFGTSGGGLVCAFLGTVEKRVQKYIVSNYGGSFKSCIMSLYHCIDNYIPDILSIGEAGDILSLICPARFMLINGEHDPIFPSEGVRESAHIIQRAYDAAGVGERFKLCMFDGGHEVNADAVIEFIKEK